MSVGPRPVPPVIGWRGFHSELRRAAMAATQTGAPLSLLILELAGLPAIGRCHGAAVAGGLVRALVGLLEAELGAEVALARYAADRLCIVMPGVDLGVALARAERVVGLLKVVLGRGAGQPELDLLPAIGVAQFADEEPLGHLIERALEALGRARAGGTPAAVAAPERHGRTRARLRSGGQ